MQPPSEEAASIMANGGREPVVLAVDPAADADATVTTDPAAVTTTDPTATTAAPAVAVDPATGAAIAPGQG